MKGGAGFGKGKRPPDGIRFTAWYRDLVDALNRRDLLPAIVFIFSRAGCDRAAAEVGGIASKLGLLSHAEKKQIKDRLSAFRLANPQVPLEKEKVRLLLCGLATHHAGLLPVYKALVEELFNENLIRVVFATETLAAGVNMPARATVISTLSKKIGKVTINLQPSQLLQMAGRAGRRGKDTMGHVVLMRSRSEDALDAFNLLCAPVDSIRSHFRSSYAMVVNILRTRDLESCKLLVERSFGNYLKAYSLGEEQEVDIANRDELKGRLGGVDAGELRMYEDLQEKLMKATRAERNLKREAAKLEEKYVKAVLGAVRLGAGLLLRDGRTLALIGEATLPHPLTNTQLNLYVGLSQNGKLEEAGEGPGEEAGP
ncbi:type iii restriction res subunit [Nannochloropsis gaditana CCMP526]|uniref:type iii restriction res subunit n=1 Tax=Nannochloropsis gaditana (strain CCMP526) TaxID=1093141 RepID=UPI00029F7955|nr:type iii restriction res subunit [Nannochloropsis gaditana CCMP526]EKU21220.1 type iii restriction res subunit [Nannochloropsis gaditana CCMP526]|eukprot:XP_005855138.1 type iii restriction res subunit [Nannochloropsis gaditana CCMP526]